jgi:ABC-type phosphate transport system substrate-binding protein
MVNKFIRKSLVPIAFCAISSHVWADVVIVVHPSNSATIDTKQAQRIFLGKEKKFSDGKEALPINSTSGYPSREQFDSTVLKRSSSQVSAYWSKLVFTGKGIPPKEVDDDAAVIAIIANNQNAVGYIDSSAVTGDVKVIPLN